MNEVPQDIPSPVDFHSVEAAQAWAKEAEQKLPSRLEFFNFFVAELTLGQPHTVLELGSGPGFLAEYILTRCPFIHHYALLDFSGPMIEMSRKRLDAFDDRISFHRVDFKQPHWTDLVVGGPYEAIVTIQAVHELRHKRYATAFYSDCKKLIRENGIILICDRVPQDDSERDRALFMTAEEQIVALTQAGFGDPVIRVRTNERVACRAVRL